MKKWIVIAVLAIGLLAYIFGATPVGEFFGSLLVGIGKGLKGFGKGVKSGTSSGEMVQMTYIWVRVLLRV